MLQAQQRAVTGGIQPQRDGEGGQDPGHRGVDPGMQHAIPGGDGQQGIGQQPLNPPPRQHDHQGQGKQSCCQPGQLDLRGVEQRDNCHRAQVVDDGHGQQEQPQGWWRPLAQQRKHADGKRLAKFKLIAGLTGLILAGGRARRMGGDKNPDGEFVYVGNSFGGNLARINIKSNEVDLIPLPNPATQQPYQVAVDQRHQVWTNLWSTDAVAKYDPATSQWTLFDLPSRGTETRHVSLLEKDGKLQVVLPYSRTRRVAVMTVRSEDEIKSLAARAAR